MGFQATSIFLVVLALAGSPHLALDLCDLPLGSGGEMYASSAGQKSSKKQAPKQSRMRRVGEAADTMSPRTIERIRERLVTLPFYDVFDNLAFRVQGRTVILEGQVRRPTTKSAAEARVKDLEGVERVINNIEVLPVSPHDDDIRIATFRAIYSQAPLQRYAFRAVPPIHIIVKNGHVTLEGVVATEMDKTLAYTAARGVSGVFSVTNNLRVEKE